MRFHLLGLPNAPISKKYNSNPFIIKCYHMADMMTSLGYEVFAYGVAGSEANANNITCLSSESFDHFYPYNPEIVGYDYDDLQPWREFNSNCARAIETNKQDGDVILCPMGHYHDLVRDYTKLPCVEFSIGHIASTDKNYRIFESYSWANFVYGSENKQLPHEMDTVIPAFFDPKDFDSTQETEKYLLFIGRLIPEKGIDLAIKTAEYAKMKLIIAGVGDYKPQSDYVEYIGSVNVEQRKELLAKAKALLVPSQYNEPFGSVVIEAMLSGTPIISSNRGALPEINLHRQTGFVCWCEQDYYDAYDNLIKLQTDKNWKHYDRYSKEKVCWSYDTYFKRLDQYLKQDVKVN